MKRFLLPLFAFAILLAFLAMGLLIRTDELPSALIGKPAPGFSLPQVEQQAHFQSSKLKGKVWLLNVWASWCESCRHEHPVLLKFAGQLSAPVIGLDYMDKAADAKRWLSDFGNPYQLSVQDVDGRAATDYGVVGVPETFVIDIHGLVRYKHVGPLTEQVVFGKLQPLIDQLQREQ
ncbi:DsbE family thiol:disulfide interchange protein [Undibacterium sp. Di27W]|uniref:DsbE family thiol:disulfide interchange protein n=1 Tax=Undibacterium sp. Di27W TaxID=3413036 RepID=UPI003BF1EA07